MPSQFVRVYLTALLMVYMKNTDEVHPKSKEAKLRLFKIEALLGLFYYNHLKKFVMSCHDQKRIRRSKLSFLPMPTLASVFSR